VLAAGGCVVTYRGTDYTLVEPEVIDYATAAPAFRAMSGCSSASSVSTNTFGFRSHIQHRMDITPAEFIDSYVKYERSGTREPRPHLVNEVFARFVRAEHRTLTPDEFWRLVWLFSSDNEPAIRLTQNGTKRLLQDVAAEYERQVADGYTWDGNENHIKPILAVLEPGGQIDPVYLRERYANEPADGSYYIEDGIHRLTALAVHALRHGLDPSPEAFIGHFHHRPASRLGILAYGSLIDDPGPELQEQIVGCIESVTPFQVEFARESTKRGGGPTLVPVANGGAHVRAVILLLREEVSVESATDMLYRRECHETDLNVRYEPTPNPGPNSIIIEHLDDFHALEVVLFTRIGPNIPELSGSALAARAIASVTTAESGKDGISYLIAAKKNGLVTALSPDYGREILRQTGTENLEAALRSIKPG